MLLDKNMHPRHLHKYFTGVKSMVITSMLSKDVEVYFRVWHLAISYPSVNAKTNLLCWLGYIIQVTCHLSSLLKLEINIFIKLISKL